MQLKFDRQSSIGHSVGKTVIKFFLILIIALTAFFLIEKINFPSPNKNINKDVTNEIIKLK